MLPVADGQRVCLVYHLILKHCEPVAVPDYRKTEAVIAAELKALSRYPEGLSRFVWVLGRVYNKADLSFDKLKELDTVIGRVLLTAAAHADYDLHLACLRYNDMGVTKYDSDQWDEDDTFKDHSIDDYDCWLETFIRSDRESIDYGKLKLEPGELMPPGKIKDERPDSTRVKGGRGSNGAPFKRLYRRAAFVLWPKKAILQAFKGSDPDVILAIASYQRKMAASPAQIGELASQLVSAWPTRHRLTMARQSADALSLLCELDHAKAISNFISRSVLPCYYSELNPGIVTAAEKLGPKWTGAVFTHLVRPRRYLTLEHVIDLSSRLVARFGDSSDESWPNILRSVVVAMFQTLPTIEIYSEDRYDAYRQPTIPKEAEFVSEDAMQTLFALGWHFDLAEEIAELAKHFLACPELASPNRAIPQLLNGLWRERIDAAKRCGSFDRLWSHSVEFLLSRSGTRPNRPTDWKLPTDRLDCDCRRCDQLRQFCADPKARSHQFEMADKFIKHLIGEINHSQIGIRYEYVPKKRSSLTCHKTRKHHKQRLEEYRKDIEHMQILMEVAEAVADSTETTEKLEAAIARAN